MDITKYRVGTYNTTYLLAHVHPQVYLSEWFKDDEARKVYINLYHYLASQEREDLISSIYTERKRDDIIDALKYLRSVSRETNYHQVDKYKEGFLKVFKLFVNDVANLIIKFSENSLTSICPTVPEVLGLERYQLEFDFQESHLPNEPCLLFPNTFSRAVSIVREGSLDKFMIQCGVTEETDIYNVLDYESIVNDVESNTLTPYEEQRLGRLLTYLYLKQNSLAAIVEEKGE